MSSFNRIDSTSNRLKIAMKNVGKKQADLVRETGIDKGSLSHYVSGRYVPKQDTIYKLAKALDVSEMWLWGYDCDMERPIEQKESDELIELINRLRKDKGFRSLVNDISKLNPLQLEAIKNVVAAFPVE